MNWEFGAYRFREDSGLSLGDQSIPLPPKETQLLTLLLERRGDFVTHEEIEAWLWPDEEIAYSSLARVVHSLRKALGGERQEFIATVPKRGYRLRVPIRAPRQGQTSTTVTQTVATDRTTYAHFLEGQREANRGSPEGQARAVELFEKALRRDPKYVVAAAAIAEIHVYQAMRGYLLPRDALSLGVAACERALTIDPTHVAARCVAAWFDGVMNGNPEPALDSISQAMQDDPWYAHGEVYRSFVYRALGRTRDGVAAAERARELDPFSLSTAHAVAWSLFCAGRVTEALELEQSITLELPHVDVAQAYRAVFAAWLGKHDEAERACSELLKSHASNPAIMCAVGYAWARQGKVSDALALASKLEAAENPWAPRTQIASIYAGAGEDTRALALLEVARDEHCPWFPVARVDRRFDPLADSPDFRSLFE